MTTDQDVSALLEQVTRVWADLANAIPATLRNTVAEVVVAKAADIADTFYEHMLAHHSAQRFLNHDMVKQRLRHEMQRWLRSLFPPLSEQHPEAQVAQQIAVGAVHARIKLPVELMSIGGHILSRELAMAVSARLADAGERATAIHYIMQIFALASGLILSAFVRETQRGVRNDEAYRQLALRHDAVLERERQRAALSEWAQRLLMALPVGARRAAVVPLRKSEFGQWLVHKGRTLFSGVADFDAVVAAVEHIDMALVPRLLDGTLDDDARGALLDDFDSRVEFIRYTVNDMFERVPQTDMGRDAVTRLLNRRHLYSILSRELDNQLESSMPFTVSLLRVSGLQPAVLGADSEEARHAALQRVAVALTDHTGAGDYVFRYTDSDFLIVEVDSTLERSLKRRQELWRKVISIYRDIKKWWKKSLQAY